MLVPLKGQRFKDVNCANVTCKFIEVPYLFVHECFALFKYFCDLLP